MLDGLDDDERDALQRLLDKLGSGIARVAAQDG